MYMGMLLPLFVAAIGYSLVFAAIVTARLRAAVMEQRIRSLLLARVDNEGRTRGTPTFQALQ